MIIPVRIAIAAGFSDTPSCAFTANISFSQPPTKGDKILFMLPTGQTGLVVVDICHFVVGGESEAICLCVMAPLVMTDYDEMLTVIDWFKSNYEIDSFTSDQEPAYYYKFYRSVLHVLDLTKDVNPIVKYSPLDIKIFAESCRAVLAAEISMQLGSQEIAIKTTYDRHFADLFVDLHRLVLARRVTEQDGARLLNIVKEWTSSLKPIDREAKASVESCIVHARAIFAGLPSVPQDKLPLALRIT